VAYSYLCFCYIYFSAENICFAKEDSFIDLSEIALGIFEFEVGLLI